MAWARRRFRGQLVYARVDAEGRLVADADGRVEMKYRLADPRLYRAGARNLEEAPGERAIFPDEAAAPAEAVTPPASGVAATRAREAALHRALPADAVLVYTDGACTGNPGPMGVGVVLLDGGERRELSEFLGHGTNNIAELTAIARALDAAPRDGRTVVIHTDSSYAIGVLSKGWKAKANGELIAAIRRQAAAFRELRFVKVAGHAGVPENERCDELARAAVTRGR